MHDLMTSVLWPKTLLIDNKLKILSYYSGIAKKAHIQGAKACNK